MPPSFPCPNPSCTQTFSSQAIQVVSNLVCPKCGTVFQFVSGAAATKKPAPELPPPLAAALTESEQIPAHFDFDSMDDPASPRSRRRRGRRRLGGWIVAVLAGILGPAVAVWGGLWLRDFLATSSTAENKILTIDPFNARFVLPGNPWTRDKDMQMRFHVHIGMKSSEHNLGMALFFKDYRDRMPRDAEMVDEAIGKLRSYFQGLEWEQPSKGGSARLVEHSAGVLKFQGEDSEQVTMNGECYMLAFRGFGYWFFTWAPLGELENDRDAIQAEWARLRQGFSLLDGRKGWKAKPRQMEVVSGKKAKYRLSYVKGLWTREASEDEDAQIDLLLRGQEPDPDRRPLAGKDATIQVLVLPRQADLKSATAAALDYVKQREMKLYERTTWEPIKDKNGEVDRDTQIGEERGHVSKLHVKNTEDLERYLSVAVANRPEGVVVLVGDCLWERRDFWDQELTALFNTFTVR